MIGAIVTFILARFDDETQRQVLYARQNSIDPAGTGKNSPQIPKYVTKELTILNGVLSKPL